MQSLLDGPALLTNVHNAVTFAIFKSMLKNKLPRSSQARHYCMNIILYIAVDTRVRVCMRVCVCACVRACVCVLKAIHKNLYECPRYTQRSYH